MSLQEGQISGRYPDGGFFSRYACLSYARTGGVRKFSFLDGVTNCSQQPDMPVWLALGHPPPGQWTRSQIPCTLEVLQ